MKQVLTALFSAVALSALLSAAPASAQVAGNPGDLHTPTQYTQSYGQPAYGQPSFFAPVGALVGAVVTPFGVAPAPGAVAVQQPGCRAFQDFNGRRTAVCGP
jgi:hypothetical protein